MYFKAVLSLAEVCLATSEAQKAERYLQIPSHQQYFKENIIWSVTVWSAAVDLLGTICFNK